MKLKERLRRWLDKKSLERELSAFGYFHDIDGVHEVLREMRKKGYFEAKK